MQHRPRHATRPHGRHPLRPFVTTVVVATVLSACASSGPRGGAATSLAPVGVTDAPGTLPPTIAPRTTVTTAAATTVATTAPPTTAPPATTAAARGDGDLTKPDTWPIAGSVVGDSNASLVVHNEPRGPLCVGVRLTTGQVLDACNEAGTSWYAVLPGPERLYVVAGRVPDAHLVVSTSAGGLDAAPLPAGAGAARPYGVAGIALARGASIVSVDGGADQSGCSYRGLFAALTASGAVGSQMALAVEQCEASAASAVLPGSSQGLQGAEALFDRGPDGQWDAVSVGSEVCVDPSGIDTATLTDVQQAQLARAASVCRTLGR